ncbi:hypothetical protein J8273_1094 [Carpediemonas membranifera]|uniref:Uncharacterized protein n=1 Tax=Carpediemonas membranifera TaxID=201153 RepID=A0A8J6B2U7_9EUKA|nr:hypothetical protein J8273_1094 [Carpediemonas membranifera]|eukprot:KAG9397185.1 hypothetical protein J8273_1094 [Carpediemonas membranifera]
MARDHIQTLLLCALPASGKSETRKFLASLSDEDLKTNFKIAETVQLDDYPYVDMMRKIDDALMEKNQPRMFFAAADKGFINSYDWGTLMHLINEDYEDLINKPARPAYEHSSKWMFERMDAARALVGIKDSIMSKPADVLEHLYSKLDATNDVLMSEKFDCFPDTLEDKTVVIEFARGGAQGSEMPLKPPMGYEYSFSCLSDRILSGAAVLYVWVTPEMSRAKNIARAQEKAGDAATSANLSLNHGVPMSVMLGDYGCDDIEYLLETSGIPDAVKITAQKSGKEFVIPLGRFDNREDLTTFARGPRAEWSTEDIAKIRAAFEKCFAGLTERYVNM